MKNVLTFVKGLTWLGGMLAVAAWIGSVAYVLKRLKSVTDLYKFGPARKANYLAEVVHQTNRTLDTAAIEEWRAAQDEDVKHYADMEEEHDRLLAEARKNGTWN
jgi:hypothetical protein